MSDEYDGECERKAATEMTVRLFHGDRPGTSQAGMTRRGGILATGQPDERQARLDAFRGKELMRRSNNR